MSDQFSGTETRFNGKTIESIETRLTWRDNETSSWTIHFTDGTTVNIDVHTEAGCQECDPDGSALTYLSIFSKGNEK